MKCDVCKQEHSVVTYATDRTGLTREMCPRCRAIELAAMLMQSPWHPVFCRSVRERERDSQLLADKLLLAVGQIAAATTERDALKAELERQVDNIRVQLRDSFAGFAEIINEAITAISMRPDETRLMLIDLRDGLEKIAEVS